MAPIEIHRQLCQVYGPDIMSKQMVRRWCRQFSEGRQNVHDVERIPRLGRTCGANNREKWEYKGTVHQLSVDFKKVRKRLHSFSTSGGDGGGGGGGGGSGGGDGDSREWRKLHNTELHALYSSPDIITNIKSRRLRWAGHVARMGESRNAYRVLVGRPEGKRPLGRPRRRWEDNIKMDLREVGYMIETGLILLRIGINGGPYEPPGSLKNTPYLTPQYPTQKHPPPKQVQKKQVTNKDLISSEGG
ncbi:hypothetical protein ANN_08736 [Periplaneta americana]|uniref:Mos1 transposase HTH domain-containing protein n=1 Tax=Periplaneta americana TaxID=6978 RepID=A0ABQ8T276_PERAM|nr:hypothetical protein ANN_08736 [Periplaneta americana]